jgi:oligoribonuclease NrnB/cAMP/cGMP phosphodiesterase (DHH superfamily)
MKVKLFTHDDLDGVGCALVALSTFGDDVDIDYCNYDNIDKLLTEFVAEDSDGYSESDKYDMVYITDIHPEVECTAKVLNKVINDKLLMFDHHKTSDWLNDYEWANIVPTSATVKFCGTELFYNNFDVKLNEEFIHLIHDLDTWEWEAKDNWKAYDLAILLDFYGIDKFIEEFKYSFNNCNIVNFNNIDDIIIKAEHKKMEQYFKDKNKYMITKQICGQPAGVVFGEQYHSLLGNQLSKWHPELDFIVIVNMAGGISYRCVKNNVDVSEIAKYYGGGGHQKASGSRIKDEQRSILLQILFDKKVE